MSAASPDDDASGEHHGLLGHAWKSASARSPVEGAAWCTRNRKAAVAFLLFVLLAWAALLTIDSAAFHSPDHHATSHLSPAEADVMRLLTPLGSSPSLRLAQIFSSHMVLQRDQVATISGWAKPGETVSVTMQSSHSQLQGEAGSAVASADGRFEYEFQQAYPASSGWRIAIQPSSSSSSDEPAVLEDVAFGDVILCAGEANMVHTVHGTHNALEEIADSSNYPLLRMFTSAVHASTHVASVITAKTNALNTTQTTGWVVAGPAMFPATGDADTDLWSSGSATCFFAGRTLVRQHNNVPIGLIVVAHHHAAIDAWSTAAGAQCKEEPKTQRQSIQLTTLQAESDLAETEPSASTEFDRTRLAYPASLFNGMILPLAPLQLKAIVWYQGETDALEGNGAVYECALGALVHEWRDAFEAPTLSFFIVQLAARQARSLGRNDWALVQQAQEYIARTTDHTYLVSAMDIGDARDGSILYPANKLVIGYRVAAAIAKRLFRMGNTAGGPLVDSIVSATDSTSGRSQVTVRFQSIPESSDLHFGATPLCAHHENTPDCCKPGESGAGGELFEFHSSAAPTSIPPASAWIRSSGWEITRPLEITFTLASSLPAGAQIDAIRYAWSSWPQCAVYNGKHMPLAAFTRLMDGTEAGTTTTAEVANPLAAEEEETPPETTVAPEEPIQPTTVPPIQPPQQSQQPTPTPTPAAAPDAEEDADAAEAPFSIVGSHPVSVDTPELMPDLRYGQAGLPAAYPFRAPQERNSFYLTAVPNPGAGLGHQFGEWLNGPWIATQTGIQYVFTGFGSNSKRWNGYFNFQLGEPQLEDLEVAFGRGKLTILQRDSNAERASHQHAIDWVRTTMKNLREKGANNPELPSGTDEAWRHLEREVPYPVLFVVDEVHVTTTRQVCEAHLYAALRRKYCLARLKMPMDVDLYKHDRTPHPPAQSKPKIIVAFHLRCGDSCFSVYRSTPFDSIVHTAERIRVNLHQLEPDRQMAIHLFSQKPHNDTAEHHFAPLVHALHQSMFATVVTHFTTHGHTTLHHLVTADVLIGAQSSFSWVGFLLHYTVSLGPVKNCFHSVDYRKDTGAFDEDAFRQQYALARYKVPKFDSIDDCDLIQEEPSELYEFGNFTLQQKVAGVFKMTN